MNITNGQSPTNEQIYEAFELFISSLAIFICILGIFVTLIMKQLRCNLFCSVIRFMCIAGIGTEILKLVNVFIAPFIHKYPTLCPMVAITSNGFWIWQDFLMVLYILRFLNYILRNNQVSCLKIANSFERWDFLVHILIFIFSFLLFASIYLIFLSQGINIFKYDPVVKKCEFESKVNIILVVSVESLVFLINLSLIILIIYQVAKLKTYNKDEKAPWTRYLAMSLYPLIWGCTFFIVFLGMIISSKNNNEMPTDKGFFDYIYLFFGPRFQTIMILFVSFFQIILDHWDCNQ